MCRPTTYLDSISYHEWTLNMATSDFTKAPDQILVDLINADNGTSLTTALIGFGVPTAATGASPARNTELEVSAKSGSGYKGSVVVLYNRLQIQDFVNSTDFPDGLSLPVGDATKYSDLIPEINTALGINLTAADYVDGDIGVWQGTPNEQKVINIPMKADALCYLGTLQLTLVAEDIELSTVITTLTLNGLNLPA